jgi:hypothetical protein
MAQMQCAIAFLPVARLSRNSGAKLPSSPTTSFLPDRRWNGAPLARLFRRKISRRFRRSLAEAAHATRRRRSLARFESGYRLCKAIKHGRILSETRVDIGISGAIGVPCPTHIRYLPTAGGELPMKATALSSAPSGKEQPRIGIRRRRSRVTNGSALFATGPQTSAYARRLRDVLGEVISDLGGPDELSEAERQLARRAASLSVACEKLEESICTGISSAAAAAFTQNTGGLSPYAILAEAGRVLHSVARIRGGGEGGVRAMAELPANELDRVTDLLCRAGDLAAKCISAGSEQSADLELLGQLSDRCGRAFLRIGLRRRPREVESLDAYLARYERESEEAATEALQLDGAEGHPPTASGGERTGGHAKPGMGLSEAEEGDV